MAGRLILGKEDNSSSADAVWDSPEDHYVILHTRVGIPKAVVDDPKASFDLSASYADQGDIVPASLLGEQVARLVRLGAVRKASTDEVRDAAVLSGARDGTEEVDPASTTGNPTDPAPREQVTSIAPPGGGATASSPLGTPTQPEPIPAKP